VPNLPTDALNALTSIDTVPTREQLDTAFQMGQLEPLSTLTGIVASQDKTISPDGVDPGIKLRAIHALAKYCTVASACTTSDVAHQAVIGVFDDTRGAQTGAQVLMLRAAIETIGAMKVSTDAPLLQELLAHQSRDIRAATARALRDLCNPQAITPLRARYSIEMTDQVKLAISEALRILGQCAANP
jgi:hypothetical protein